MDPEHRDVGQGFAPDDHRVCVVSHEVMPSVELFYCQEKHSA